jgi:peroxiredoxin
MKKIFVVISVSFLTFSCAVEQFQVNTKTESFENGGRVFGESTKGLKKNQDFTRSHTLFVIGINLLSDYEVNEMAKKIGAEHYTIETKRYLIGNLCRYFTGGLVDGKRVTVIKRAD